MTLSRERQSLVALAFVFAVAFGGCATTPSNDAALDLDAGSTLPGDGPVVPLDAAADAPGESATCGDYLLRCCSDNVCGEGLACDGGRCVETRATEAGKPCNDDSECTSGTCLRLANGARVCTTPCNESSKCPPGWTCDDKGSCACAPSDESCDGLDNDCDGIVDDRADADRACAATAPGNVCKKGACVCESTCGGVCVDSNTDEGNCGGCGTACSAGALCLERQCVCLNGGIACNGNCIDAQKDAKHCGACNVACGEGALCGAGACRTITAYWPAEEPPAVATGLQFPSIAVDATHVYFEEYGMLDEFTTYATVHRVPLGGGADQVVGSGHGITVDATHVYFGADGTTAATGIFRRLKDLSQPQASVVANASVGPFVVDGTSVYFHAMNPSPGIYRAPKSGGTATLLAASAGSLRGMAVDATSLVWSELPYDFPTASMHWAVKRVPIAGGSTITIADGPSNVSTMVASAEAVATDGTHVYWHAVFNGTHSIHRALPSGAGDTVLTSGLDLFGTSAIALDGSNLFIAGSASRSIVRLALAGGPPVPIASRGGKVMALALDPLGGAVFSTTTNTGGRIDRVNPR